MILVENKRKLFPCLICEQRDKSILSNQLDLCNKCYESFLDKESTITKTIKDYFPEINKITNKIFLGNYDGQNEKAVLKILGITHVLACGATFIDNNNGEYEFLKLKFFDMSTENLFRVLKKAFYFIEKADKVYLHCQSGVSRSASVLIAFLMWKEKMKFKDALTFVRRRRPCIFPNIGFYKQLEEFGQLLEQNNYELDFLNDTLYYRFYD